MACAVKHIHDSGFIHLDIKPSNFFVKDDGTIKLGDFGQALELNKIS
jgi:serine/threonine protein kinase